MSKWDDAQARSALLAERIRQRTDLELRQWIADFDGELDFSILADLMISQNAWEYVTSCGFDPKLVFAHPHLLRKNPRISEYFRGMALLPRKRVADLASPVVSWEQPNPTVKVAEAKGIEIARLYNAVISSIIERATNWTLENGYRNIVANMGIGLDGTMRNIIGQDAEQRIKGQIKGWLHDKGLIVQANDLQTQFVLPNGYSMRFGSEPDIEFTWTDGGGTNVVSTIEIKGGKDPAGALERLGAIQKSFKETPPGCMNILIVGVITDQMGERLADLGIGKTYLLDKLVDDEAYWMDFLNEVFHHTIRVTNLPIGR